MSSPENTELEKLYHTSLPIYPEIHTSMSSAYDKDLLEQAWSSWKTLQGNTKSMGWAYAAGGIETARP